MPCIFFGRITLLVQFGMLMLFCQNFLLYVLYLFKISLSNHTCSEHIKRIWHCSPHSSSYASTCKLEYCERKCQGILLTLCCRKRKWLRSLVPRREWLSVHEEWRGYGGVTSAFVRRLGKSSKHLTRHRLRVDLCSLCERLHMGVVPSGISCEELTLLVWFASHHRADYTTTRLLSEKDTAIQEVWTTSALETHKAAWQLDVAFVHREGAKATTIWFIVSRLTLGIPAY